MTTYLINHLRVPGLPNEEILRYLEQVQATAEPYGGRWLAQDAEVQVLEGAWPGSVVLMEFPDMAKARAWYDSKEYRSILHLRANHTINDMILVDAVGPGFSTAGYAHQLRGMLSGQPAVED
ncbi:DUF1330 domain-containing protein [Plantactinospora sonchi]|uniref:DUF1330 domain-containing protein n=1 Tax=Plantactinospora sonchi TaxID=1544735 RepID=A0ABU7RKN2_9ACTN